MAILGIVLNAIDLKKYKKFSMICYLGMGWAIVFKINLLPVLLPAAGLALLVAGGIAYTIGAILYGVGKKTQMDAFDFSSIYFTRKLFTILLYIALCDVRF